MNKIEVKEDYKPLAGTYTINHPNGYIIIDDREIGLTKIERILIEMINEVIDYLKEEK